MDKKELKDKVWDTISALNQDGKMDFYLQHKFNDVLASIDQLDEPEVLSQEWIDERKRLGHFQSGDGIYFGYFIKADDLQNLLVPKQEEVDRAYKNGYEQGKRYTEGVADKESESETVADVIADFYKSLERLSEVLATKVEESEE